MSGSIRGAHRMASPYAVVDTYGDPAAVCPFCSKWVIVEDSPVKSVIGLCGKACTCGAVVVSADGGMPVFERIADMIPVVRR